LGEATTPGTYTVTSLATVFNALYAAGGPTTSGSFRKIDIIRGDSVIATFDLYDFLIYGDQSSNIRLEDQDIIQINPYLNRVVIEGEVKRPGIYELKNGETLADLIKYTGGFTGDAYTGRIKVIGNTLTEKRIVDVKKPNFDEFNLRNGAFVEVGKVLPRFANMVKIEGAVFRPGQYELTDSTTLHSLIQRAEGLMGDAFMNRGIIYRTKDDYTIKSISFDLRKVMQNPDEYDFPLIKNDIVHISSIFDMRENYTVGISGPVQLPGEYEFIYGMTLEDLIFRADGFTRSANPYRIEVARRVRDLSENRDLSNIATIFTFSVDENLDLNPKDANFKLQPFDQVYVRAIPNYEEQNEVAVVGEVKFPGVYSLSSKDDRISDLIRRAGGLTTEAYLKGATLFRDREFVEQESQQNLANVEGLTEQEQQEMLQEQRDGAQIGIDLPQVIKNPGSKYDLFLEKGDSLFIPKQLQTVTVKGAVFYPTTIRFDEDRSFEDYITSAGGFTDLAKKRHAYVIYASGKVDRVKNFLFFKNYPNVQPGATIVIPQEPDPDELTPQERVGIFSAIISTAALITTTIIQISNN
jgi:protein involved in polysaccharide export with SLBB domain